MFISRSKSEEKKKKKTVGHRTLTPIQSCNYIVIKYFTRYYVSNETIETLIWTNGERQHFGVTHTHVKKKNAFTSGKVKFLFCPY